jgi:hypothetical protein
MYRPTAPARPKALSQLLAILALAAALAALSSCGGGPSAEGTWTGRVTNDSGYYEGDTYDVVLTLRQDGDALSGEATLTFVEARSASEGQDGAVGVVDGLSGSLEPDGRLRAAGQSDAGLGTVFEGEVTGDVMEGTLTTTGGDRTSSGRMRLTRSG